MKSEEQVEAAAAALGLDVEVRAFPQGTRTAADAAAAIGCDVAQIVKSLVFVVDGEAVVALVGGSDRLDESKLAQAAAGHRVRRADADEVRAATGYAVGGVPPPGLMPLSAQRGRTVPKWRRFGSERAMPGQLDTHNVLSCPGNARAGLRQLGFSVLLSNFVTSGPTSVKVLAGK